jgi:WD40 repeat protein
VLTGRHDNTARLWEAATGKQLGPPLQHQSAVWAAAFSPDGKCVLTGSFDKTARLWETATGKQLGPPLQHQGGVLAVAFSPNGKTALTGCAHFDHTARLWRVPQQLRGDAEQILRWFQVITGLELDERGEVRVLDAAAWQQRRQRLQDLNCPIGKKPTTSRWALSQIPLCKPFTMDPVKRVRRLARPAFNHSFFSPPSHIRAPSSCKTIFQNSWRNSPPGGALRTER